MFVVLRFLLTGKGVPRQLSGSGSLFVTYFAIGIAAYHIIALSGSLWGMDPLVHNWIHLLTLVALAFLHYSPTTKSSKGITWEGAVLSLLTGLLLLFLVLNSERLLHRSSLSLPISDLEYVIGIMILFLTAEAARRAVGMPVVILGAVFIIYAVAGPIWPFGLSHPGMSFRDGIQIFVMGSMGEGFWSVPLQMSSVVIMLLMLFGGAIEKMGGGNLFVGLANAFLGGAKGGAAKVAVLSSALLGMIMGGAPSNVAVTGAFTIPAMVRSGYSPRWAGAVEAVASTGSAFTPPVMGATVFIMAELVGIPYQQLLLPALLPAVLFYIAAFMQIHLYANRHDLKGLPKEQIMTIAQVFKEYGEYLIPVGVLLYFIIQGYTMGRSALAGMAGLVIAGLIRRESRAAFISNAVEGLNNGVRTTMLIALPAAMAGILMSTVGVTGIGSKFTHFLSLVSENNVFLTLVLGALMSMLLGMGVSISISYILTVLLVVPVTIAAGIPPLAAHMFSMYYATMAYITPPVALACFVAAGIAKEDSFTIGVTSVRLAVGAFVVPFIFVYRPELLLIGSFSSTLWVLLVAAVGLLFISQALEGWIRGKCLVWERLLLVIAALALFWPGLTANLLGAVLGLAINLRFLLSKARQPLRLEFLGK